MGLGKKSWDLDAYHIDAHPPKYGEKQGVSQALTLSQRHDMDMLHSVARNVEALKNY